MSCVNNPCSSTNRCMLEGRRRINISLLLLHTGRTAFFLLTTNGGVYFDFPTVEAGMNEIMKTADLIRKEIHSVIVGQDEVIDELILCLFCGGHSLLIGVPGLAKTLLVSTIAKTLSLEFSRIQFTPDLMPSDMTGTEVMEEDKATGNRSLRFIKGPVFANLILADEINRTPPKTQAALLEAMQEQQVTTGGNRHPTPPVHSSSWQHRIRSSRRGHTHSPKLSWIDSCSTRRFHIRQKTKSRK